MSNIKAIRERLGVTQSALAEGMGCTQGNVGHYEKGQMVPSERAKQLITYAASLGHVVTYEQIYGPPDVTRQKADPPIATAPSAQQRDKREPRHREGPSNRKGR